MSVIDRRLLPNSIPLIGQPSAILFAPHPLTKKNVAMIRAWLDMMEDALTEPIDPPRKLSDMQIETIKDLATQRFKQNELAELFGVSESMISRILSGERRAETRDSL